MLFGKLLPREGDFFTLFTRHAEEIVQTASAFSQLVTNYDTVDDRERYANAVDDAEHAADRTTVEILHLLHKTFITPLEREQIHSLTNSMDDVADAIQDTTQALSLYDVNSLTPEIISLTSLAIKCCEQLKVAVEQLGQLNKGSATDNVIKACAQINELEAEADKQEQQAISALFRQEPDVRELIKLKAIYEQVEDITDRCEDVANIIEGIVLENS